MCKIKKTRNRTTRPQRQAVMNIFPSSQVNAPWPPPQISCFTPTSTGNPKGKFSKEIKNTTKSSRSGVAYKMQEERVPTFFTYVFGNRSKSTGELPQTVQGMHTVAHKYYMSYFNNSSLEQVFQNLIQPYPPDKVVEILKAEKIDNHQNIEKFNNDYVALFNDLNELYQEKSLQKYDNDFQNNQEQIVDVQKKMVRLIEMHPYGSYGWNRPNKKEILESEIVAKGEAKIDYKKRLQQIEIIVDPHADFIDKDGYQAFLVNRLGLQQNAPEITALINSRGGIIKYEKTELCNIVKYEIAQMLPAYQFFLYQRREYDINQVISIFQRYPYLWNKCQSDVRKIRDALIQINLMNQYHSDFCQLKTLDDIVKISTQEKPTMSSENLTKLEERFPLPLLVQWTYVGTHGQLYESLLSAIKNAYKILMKHEVVPKENQEEIDVDQASLEDVVNNIRNNLNINNTIRLVGSRNVERTFPGSLESIGLPVLYIKGDGNPSFSIFSDNASYYFDKFNSQVYELFKFTGLYTDNQDLFSFCHKRGIQNTDKFIDLLRYLDEKGGIVKDYIGNELPPPKEMFKIFNMLGFFGEDNNFLEEDEEELTDETNIIEECENLSEEDQIKAYKALPSVLNWGRSDMQLSRQTQFEKWQRALIIMNIMPKYINTDNNLTVFLEDISKENLEDLQATLPLTIVTHYFSINNETNPPQWEKCQDDDASPHEPPANDPDGSVFHIAELHGENTKVHYVPAEEKKEEGRLTYYPSLRVTNIKNSKHHTLSLLFEKVISTLIPNGQISSEKTPEFFNMSPLLRSALLLKTYKNCLDTAKKLESDNFRNVEPSILQVKLFNPSQMLEKNAHLEIPDNCNFKPEENDSVFIKSENDSFSFCCKIINSCKTGHPFDNMDYKNLSEIVKGETKFFLCLFHTSEYLLLTPEKGNHFDIMAYLRIHQKDTSEPTSKASGGISNYKEIPWL